MRIHNTPANNKMRTGVSVVLLGCLVTLSSTVMAMGNEQIRIMAEKLISSHPNMLAAKDTVMAGKYDIKTANSAYFPTLGISGSQVWGHEEANRSAVSPDSYNYSSQNLDVTLSQNLYAGGATKANVSKSKKQLEGYQASLEDTAEQLALRAVESHMKVLLERERVAILESALDRHRRIAGLVERRAKSGKDAASSHAQALSRVALMGAEYELAMGRLDAAMGVYQELTGETIGAFNWPGQLYDEAWDLDAYVDSNPSVRKAEASAAMLLEDVRIARAGYLPNVDLDITYNLLNQGDGDYDRRVAGNYDAKYTVNLNADWQYELGGGTLSRVDAAVKRNASANNSAEDRMSGVREALKTLRSQLASTRLAMEKHRQHAVAAEAVVGAYWKQYSQGAANRTLLDLLAVENEHFAAMNKMLNSRYQEKMMQARISRVGGRLLSVLGVAL